MSYDIICMCLCLQVGKGHFRQIPHVITIHNVSRLIQRYIAGVQGKPAKSTVVEKWKYWTLKSIPVTSFTWKVLFSPRIISDVVNTLLITTAKRVCWWKIYCHFSQNCLFGLSGFSLYAHVVRSAPEAELFGDKRMWFSGYIKWLLCFKVLNL
jgi:hypothetical protein